MHQGNNTAAILAMMLGALTAYWGFVTHESAVLSPRPAQELQPVPALVSEQFIPARLWQDPFDPTIGQAKTNDVRTTDEYFRHQLEAKFAGDSANGVTVLAVFVEAGTYPEDTEVRRRLRYATQMALLDCKYQPDDRNNLGVLILPWPVSSVLRENYLQLLDCGRRGVEWSTQLTNQPLHLPFEWFTAAGHMSNSPVLVMWLPEEQFVDYPLRRLGLLLDTVFMQVHSNVQSVAIIGPRSSNTLKAIAEDPFFGEFYTNQLGMFENKFKIYSCQATVPDADLLGCTDSCQAERSRLSRQVKRHLLGSAATNEVLVHRIALDDTLSRLMVSELSNRGVYLRRRETDRPAVDRIALFYEADTTYGRSLVRQFRNEFATAFGDSKASPQSALKHVTEIPYLRGLDGSKPLSIGAPSAGGNGKSDSSAGGRSEGDQQTDYADRVAGRLQELGDSSWQDSIGNVRAIGLLGSDVYDKLMLLQVLRKKFPYALYFTTDVDARLLHKDQQSWARNLLVASSFSLEAEKGGSLRFRDTYQTSIYRACLAALGHTKDNDVPAPTLFEVGRSSFVSLPLSTNSSPLHKGRGCISAWVVGNLAAFRANLTVAVVVFGLMLLMLFRNVGRFVYYDVLHAPQPKSRWLQIAETNIKRRPRTRNTSSRHKRVWMFVSVALSLALLVTTLILACIFGNAEGEEPFAEHFNLLDHFNGVSVWPTEAIRAFIIGFCVTSVVWAYWTYRERLRRVLVSHRFEMKPLLRRDIPPFIPVLPAPQGVWRQRLYAWHERWSITRWSRVPGPVSAAHLFIQYQQRAFFRARLYRIILFCLIYFAFAFALMMSLDGVPQSPVRGKYSTLIDKILLISCVASLIFLVGYVVDLTRLTARLIRRLGDGQTIWPAKLLRRYSKKTGLESTMLSGYIDVHFVAHHTSHVHLAIYLPFIAISLMVVSRSAFFDAWPWPPSLVAVFLFNTFLTAACAWVIRREARTVREQALESLAAFKLRRFGRAPADRLQVLIDEVKNNKMGAYAGWWHDPSIVGLLMPTGSVGAVSLIKAVLAG